MSYNQDTGKPIRISFRKGIVSLVLIAIGLILAIGQFAVNIPSYIEPLFIHVEHPLHFGFNKYDQLLRECVEDDLVNYKKLSSTPELNQAVDELKEGKPQQNYRHQ